MLPKAENKWVYIVGRDSVTHSLIKIEKCFQIKEHAIHYVNQLIKRNYPGPHSSFIPNAKKVNTYLWSLNGFTLQAVPVQTEKIDLDEQATKSVLRKLNNEEQRLLKKYYQK